MTPALVGITWACAWFGVFLAGHVVVLRWRRGAEPTRVLIRTFLVALAAALVSVAVVLRGAEGAQLCVAEGEALLVAACLFVLYGPFFYTIHTSLSVETLLILAAHGGRAPIQQLRDRFASRVVFQGRLDTMVASGYLVYEQAAYRLTAKGRCVAGSFRALKSLWRLGAGG